MSTPTQLSPAKRSQILEGARKVFSEHGYECSSVDLVAARAGVSKATVYNHFEDKRALFVACFSEQADALREELVGSLPEPSGDPEQALRQTGDRMVAALLTSHVLCLYRHTIGEAVRFPELGEALYERGPALVYERLAAWLRAWHERGVLEIDDFHEAAVRLVTLCQGELPIRSLLGLAPPPERKLREGVRRGVRAFLRLYRR